MYVVGYVNISSGMESLNPLPLEICERKTNSFFVRKFQNEKGKYDIYTDPIRV